MAWASKGGVLVGVHSKRNPTAEEWEAYSLDVEQLLARDGLRAVLIVTAGGGPNPAQRSRIAKIAGLAPIPTAVVSEAFAVRGIVTALSWLGKDICAFGPNDVERAIGHLGVEDGAATALHQEVSRLQALLDLAHSGQRARG